MKRYKLVRDTILAGVLSVVLTTTGCGNNINNTLKNRYVGVVDGTVRLLEEEETIGGALFGYTDIITGRKYNNKLKDIEIKGSLEQFLSSKQISNINGDDVFADEFSYDDWIELYNSICNKYQYKWILDSNNKNTKEVVEFSSYDKKIFSEDYESLIPNDKLWILDTSLCDINNNSDYELDRYYLIMDNDYAINNNYKDKKRLVFENLFEGFYLFSYKYYNDEKYSLILHLEGGDKSIYLSDIDGKQALFNINEFMDKEGINGKRSKYSITDLEQIMKSFKGYDIEKINSDRVFVFDASVSDIDIIPFLATDSISGLEVSDYYILVKNSNDNNFSTLSNSDDELLRGDIYINDSKLISTSKKFLFASDVDLNYNFISINDFLVQKGLEDYKSEEYFKGDLNKINDALNRIGVKNVVRRLKK